MERELKDKPALPLGVRAHLLCEELFERGDAAWQAYFEYLDNLHQKELFSDTGTLFQVVKMDLDYRWAEDKRASLGPEGAQPAIQEAVQEIEWMGKRGRYGANIGVRSEAAQQEVVEWSHAYTRLLKREDPDGWLLGFLEANPKFTESIGGIPEWMQ